MFLEVWRFWYFQALFTHLLFMSQHGHCMISENYIQEYNAMMFLDISKHFHYYFQALPILLSFTDVKRLYKFSNQLNNMSSIKFILVIYIQVMIIHEITLINANDIWFFRSNVMPHLFCSSIVIVQFEIVLSFFTIQICRCKSDYYFQHWSSSYVPKNLIIYK